MDYLMGVDLGSTTIKAVVYDADGRMMASGSRPTERFHPDPGHPDWTVWQPEQIWQGAAAAIREAVDRLGRPEAVRGLSVTGMGMDGLPIDAEGRWLYPLISWHDLRTLPQFEWWKTHVGMEKTFSIGGNPVWPINSALRMLWVAENEPEIYARTDKWLLIEDFLNFMLCGRRATDYSMASCTLLFDQRQLAWSEEMLVAAGLDRRLLCEALPSGTRLGEVHAAAARATGLRDGTPVVLGGHDHLCGALPVSAFRPGVALDVAGTWEIVMTPTLSPVLDPAFQRSGMTVQAHVAPGAYALWGASVAGEMLEWYRRELDARPAAGGPPETDQAAWTRLMQSAAASPPGARGVLFLPHMSGASCPVVDERSRGAFAGLGSRTTAGDLLRAVVEGLNFQFLDIVSAMESGLGKRAERFIAVGGATRNAFWMQNKADLSGRGVEAPGVEEATPLGAAMLAGLGVGVYASLDEALERVYRPGRTYEPDERLAARYVELFDVYRQLYPSLAGVHRRLFAASQD